MHQLIVLVLLILVMELTTHFELINSCHNRVEFTFKNYIDIVSDENCRVSGHRSGSQSDNLRSQDERSGMPATGLSQRSIWFCVGQRR